MGFRPGQGGRPFGATNKVTQEVRNLTKALFDKAYWARTKKALKDGTLNPQIEGKLLAYAYGEPKQVFEVSGTDGGPITHRVFHEETE